MSVRSSNAPGCPVGPGAQRFALLGKVEDRVDDRDAQAEGGLVQGLADGVGEFESLLQERSPGVGRPKSAYTWSRDS
ncbi:hypothetical protein [Nonomuraea lactucae]|uniref:hypothetical protein n=1 Tax=Nonomuraea lactucae TaxID=2249762 RepID=UPI0013B4554B|nr:hypothetical protein [Nonomuraea lactucae]